MIFADTDVLIDYLTGVEPATAAIAAYIEDEALQTTAITCFELLSGAGEGKRGDAVRELVRVLNVLPLDRLAAERAALVRHHLENSGLGIGMADSLIAGIALVHDAPLFTRNAKHFNRVPDLKLIASSKAK